MTNCKPEDPFVVEDMQHRHRSDTQPPPPLSQPNIEVNTVTDPHFPRPSASFPDDDPTGVRALLSGLPQPDPMPEHLVERINASLAAAQAERAERTASSPGGSVTPLVASARRRPGRVLFAIAGAAAAVALITVVGGNLIRPITAGSSTSAAGAIAPTSREAGGGASADTLDKAAVDGAAPAPVIQIRRSQTRYTEVAFTAQARTLGSDVFDAAKSVTPGSPAFAEGGLLSTAVGLTDCLRAVGADGARMVRADLAFYEGKPAVIIVATTTAGIPTAYAVGPACSLADPDILRPATALP